MLTHLLVLKLSKPYISSTPINLSELGSCPIDALILLTSLREYNIIYIYLQRTGTELEYIICGQVFLPVKQSGVYLFRKAIPANSSRIRTNCSSNHPFWRIYFPLYQGILQLLAVTPVTSIPVYRRLEILTTNSNKLQREVVN